jgi:hypothetical protein
LASPGRAPLPTSACLAASWIPWPKFQRINKKVFRTRRHRVGILQKPLTNWSQSANVLNIFYPIDNLKIRKITPFIFLSHHPSAGCRPRIACSAVLNFFKSHWVCVLPGLLNVTNETRVWRGET